MRSKTALTNEDALKILAAAKAEAAKAPAETAKGAPEPAKGAEPPKAVEAAKPAEPEAAKAAEAPKPAAEGGAAPDTAKAEPKPAAKAPAPPPPPPRPPRPEPGFRMMSETSSMPLDLFAACAARMAMVTEDRKRLGLFPDLDVAANVSLCALDEALRGGFLSRSAEEALAAGPVAPPAEPVGADASAARGRREGVLPRYCHGGGA